MSIDLDVLRPSTAHEDPRPRKGAQLVMGTVLVLGALTWGFFLLRPTLFPARHVSTAAVRVEQGGASSKTTAVVESTGWIEPAPFPIQVRPLVDGVVESMEVVEGRVVKAGETVLARLRSATLEAALEKAERALSLASAQLPVAQAERDEASRLLVQRLDLRREVARLDGEVALAKAEQAAAEAETDVAERALQSALAELEAQSELERRGSGVAVGKAKAQAAVDGARATVVSKRAAIDRAKAALAAGLAQLSLAREGLDAPVALEAGAAKAEARFKAAEAEVALATTDRDVAAREAGWLVVKAPVDGVVLLRNAAPGSAVGPSVMPRGGEGGSGGEGSVVSLYDPKHLQARIDVLLGSVGGVGAGQKAELFAEALPGRTFHGSVTRVVAQADPLKNTLQVKVQIEDPDPMLKPEMLVRARFLGAAAAPGKNGPEGRVLVPKAAVRGGAVFVLDPRRGGRARRVPVTVVGEAGDLVEVRGDLGATQHVILDEVKEDERVDGGAS